jgi:hypothetical protein
LLLNRKQSGELGMSRMQVYFDYGVVENLKFDEAEILHSKRGGIVIGFGIP